VRHRDSLFEVAYEGIFFGLVPERNDECPEGEEEEEEDDWAELYPNDLGFKAPWDGGYNT